MASMKDVREYLGGPIAEFAEFWKACNSDEKAQFQAEVDSINAK